jgi:hypothetical protein
LGWYVAATELNVQARTLTVRVDFAPGSRFAVPGVESEHPVHGTVHDRVPKRYRHLNFFQHECFLEGVPRVRLTRPGPSTSRRPHAFSPVLTEGDGCAILTIAVNASRRVEDEDL